MDEHEGEYDVDELSEFDPWDHHNREGQTEYYSSPDDEEEFLYKEFTKEYKWVYYCLEIALSLKIKSFTKKKAEEKFVTLIT